MGDGLRLAAPRLSLIVNNSILDDLYNQKSLKGVVGTPLMMRNRSKVPVGPVDQTQ